MKNTLVQVFVFAVLVMVTALPSTVICQEEDFPIDSAVEAAAISSTDDQDDPAIDDVRGIERLLKQKETTTSRILGLTALLSCNVYPKKCKEIGSPGQDCCNNICVNMSNDHINCGKCGKKCNFLERCCNGKCVNPLNDTNNCGSCSNKCRHHPHKNTNCVYAMCNYA